MQPVRGRPVPNSPRGSPSMGTHLPEKHTHECIHFCLKGNCRKGVKGSNVMAAGNGRFQEPGGTPERPASLRTDCLAAWLTRDKAQKGCRTASGCAVLRPMHPLYCKINSGWMGDKGWGQSLFKEGVQPCLNLT